MNNLSNDSQEKHPDWEQVIPVSPAQLAKTLGDLKYNELAIFLEHLGQKIGEDAEKDRLRGRTSLALSLYRAANHLKNSAEAVDKAWAVCAPHMNVAHDETSQTYNAATRPPKAPKP